MRPYLLPIIVCAAVLNGCGKSEEAPATSTTGTTVSAKTSAPAEGAVGQLAGNWENAEAAADGAVTSFTFKEDGTYTMDVDAPMPDKNIRVMSHVTGNYKLEGDKLSLHVATIDMSSKDETVNAALKKDSEAMKEALAKAPDTTGKVEWPDKDNAIITTDAVPSLNVASSTYKLKRKV